MYIQYIKVCNMFFKSINTTVHEAKCIGNFTGLYWNSSILLSNNKLAEMFKCVSLITYWTHRKNIIHNSTNIKNSCANESPWAYLPRLILKTYVEKFNENVSYSNYLQSHLKPPVFIRLCLCFGLQKYSTWTATRLLKFLYNHKWCTPLLRSSILIRVMEAYLTYSNHQNTRQ